MKADGKPDCVLEINGLSVISREVVETARESLVIGTLTSDR